jgi:hypothetical protein
VPQIIARNKARAKYEPIKGITKSGVWHRVNDVQRKRDIAQRIFVVMELGGKCVSCGNDSDTRALVLDHKYGNGSEDRAKIGTRIARYYSRNIEEAKAVLQVLCCNCNAIKAIENNEHNKTRRFKEKPILTEYGKREFLK